MDQSKVAVRYAKAAFEFAKEQNQLNAFVEDIKKLENILKQNNDIFHFFGNPVITIKEKLKTTDEIFSNKFNDVTVNVIKLTVKNKRGNHLKAICRRVDKLYKDQEGIRALQIKSADNLDEKTKEALVKNVKNALNTNKLEISEFTDNNLIGGFVLRVEDIQYDASVKTQLEILKKNFKEKSF